MLLVVVLGVCIVWPTSALASVSWSATPQEVTSASESSNLPDLMNVLGDPSGSTISAFQSDSTGFATDTLSSVGWSPATVTNSYDLGPHQPSVFAMGPKGDQAAAYVVPCPDSSAPSCIYLARRASGASAWDPSILVAAPPGSTTTPAVAVDANGNATVAWLEYDVNNNNYSWVKAATYNAATSTLGQVTTLSGEEYIVQPPKIALDGDGTASVTWIDGDYSSSGNQVLAATRPAPTATSTDPAWSTAAALPISGTSTYTAYAFSTAQPGTTGPGSVVVALCHLDASGNPSDADIELLTHDSSGWTDSVVYSNSDPTSCTEDWSGLFVGRDTAGTTSVGWVEPQDGGGVTQGYEVWEADQSSDGSWSAPTDLTGGSVPSFNSQNVSSQLVRPVFAEDPKGDLIAAWAQLVGSSWYDQQIFADVRPAGGSFSGPQQVAEDGDPSSQAEVLAVSPAIDGNGDATVIWEHFVGATTPQTQDLRAVSTTAPIGSSSGSGTPTPTSVSLDPSPNPSATGETVSITATVTPTPDGGTVDFKDGTTTICGGATVTNGQATCSYAFTSPGSHSLEADYSGDSNFASSSQTGTQQVNPVTVVQSTTTSLASNANPSTVDQAVTFTATVSPAPDGGTVTFKDGNTTISGCGSAAVNTTTGIATCTSSFGSAGSDTIQASYAGDSNYGSSSDSITQVVNSAPVTPPTTPPPPTTAQITSALSAGLSVGGSNSSIKYVLAHGAAATFNAPSAGQVQISWYYLPKGAVLASTRAGAAAAVHPLLVAHGKASAAGAGVIKVKLSLTKTGKKLLKKAKHLALTAKGTFSPTGGSAVSAKKRIKLKP